MPNTSTIADIIKGANEANKKTNEDQTSLFVKATKSDATVGFFNIFTQDEVQIASVIKALTKAGLTASIYDPTQRKESAGFGL